MSGYTNLLIDLDETLFDFHEAEHLAFEHVMSHFGIPNSPDLEAYYSHINEALWKALERKEITVEVLRPLRFERTLEYIIKLEPSLRETLSGITGGMLNDEYIHYLSVLGIYIDGAEAFLRTLQPLRADGSLHIHIITNGSAVSANGRLSASGIRQYIDGVFISETIGAAKPDILFFENVLKSLDNPAKETCLVIGDSLTSDIAGANNIGIDACLFSRDGNFPPGADDYEICAKAAGYEELLKVVRG